MVRIPIDLLFRWAGCRRLGWWNNWVRSSSFLLWKTLSHTSPVGKGEGRGKKDRLGIVDHLDPRSQMGSTRRSR